MKYHDLTGLPQPQPKPKTPGWLRRYLLVQMIRYHLRQIGLFFKILVRPRLVWVLLEIRYLKIANNLQRRQLARQRKKLLGTINKAMIQTQLPPLEEIDLYGDRETR